jgi:hypothetical protein
MLKASQSEALRAIIFMVYPRTSTFQSDLNSTREVRTLMTNVQM